jgi:hypothetical protein
MAHKKNVERSNRHDERLDLLLGGEITSCAVATELIVEWKDCPDRVRIALYARLRHKSFRAAFAPRSCDQRRLLGTAVRRLESLFLGAGFRGGHLCRTAPYLSRPPEDGRREPVLSHGRYGQAGRDPVTSWGTR